MPGPSTFAMIDQAKNNLKKLETYITTGMENCLDLSMDMVEHDKDKCDAQITDLKKIMLDYIRMQNEQQQFLEATEAVKQQARQTDEPLDMEKLLDKKLSELRATSEGMDLKQHDAYVEMEQKIDDLKMDGGAMVGTEPTQIDDDMVMTQEVTTKCPYTGKEMREPVRNKHCKHNYERDGINQAMKLRKGKTKCPVPGCINDKPISADDLQENRELRRYIEKQNRHDKRGKKT